MFLAGASDEQLKKRGYKADTIESMHILHDEIVSGQSHGKTVNQRKINPSFVKLMEQLYCGKPKKNTRVAMAYRMLLEGYTEFQMRGEGIIWEDIKIAKRYRDEYANRDMISVTLANELGVGHGVARRLQKTTRIENGVM